MKKTNRSSIAFWLFTCLALLVATFASHAQIIIVDDFTPGGVGPGNPTNHDYYAWPQSYSGGQISNVWWNWFGPAFVNAQWDPTMDANSNLNSGSLKITANFTSDPDTSTYSQWVVWDAGTSNNYYGLNLSGLTYSNFQCDVRFAPGSASDIGGSQSPVPIFGHLRFGNRTGGYSQDWFGGVDIPTNNTGWVHVSLPLNAVSDANMVNINNVLIQIDSSYYGLNLNGPSTLWVDNIMYYGTTNTTYGPPTMGIQTTTPALRIFAGSGTDMYGREQLDTVDQKQSWVGGTYPVSYSFTLLSFPTVPAGSAFSFHIFLVPENSNASQNGKYPVLGNELVEYNLKNDLWLYIAGGANPGQVTAQIAWKTNKVVSNPTFQALVITNSTAVGTWTLTFTNATGGTLTAPGTNPVPFSIPAPAAALFTNPLVAFFGVQPNSPWGEGQYVDVSHIQTIGVKGVPVNDDFTMDTAINPAVWDTSDSEQPSSLVLVTTNAPYWVTWTMPDMNFLDPLTGLGELGVARDLAGQWVVPEYYNNYNDGVNIPNTAAQGPVKWTLISSTCLPTVDGQPQSGQPLSPKAFFRLYNNTNPPTDP